MSDQPSNMEGQKPDPSPEKGGRKSFVLRIKPETMELLERWAQDEFRSVNGQIDYLIYQALVKAGRK